MTNDYELALVVSSKIDDDTRAAVVEKAKGYIERFGGTIGDIEEWGKRRLAYEIQKMNEGYYYFIPFTAEPDCPNELEKEMRIMENVLRYLIVRQDGEDEFHLNVTVEEKPEAEEAPAEVKEAPAETKEAPAKTEEATSEAKEEATAEVKETAEDTQA